MYSEITYRVQGRWAGERVQTELLFEALDRLQNREGATILSVLVGA